MSISAAIVTVDFVGVAVVPAVDGAVEPEPVEFFEELLHAASSNAAAAITDSMPTYFRRERELIEYPPFDQVKRRPHGRRAITLSTAPQRVK
jgi:hypothetical protein